MLLKIFKSNHPFVILIIPLLGVALWIPSLFKLPLEFLTIEFGVTTWAYKWFFGLFSFHPKASVIFALVLLVIQSYIMIRLNFKYMFIESKTYLPSVFFVLFSSALVAYQELHPLLIGNVFILLAIDKAFLFEKSRNQFKRYFESGFLLGLGAIFYPNIFVFIVIVWLTMFYLRTFNWREWFSSIIGLITPFLFYVSALYLTNNTYNMLEKLSELLTLKSPTIQFSMYSISAIGFLGFISIIAIISGARVVGLKKISSRKYFSLFFLMILLIVAAFFLYPALGYEMLVVVSVPLSILFSIFFTEIRNKWIGELFFALTFVSVFVIIWL